MPYKCEIFVNNFSCFDSVFPPVIGVKIIYVTGGYDFNVFRKYFFEDFPRSSGVGRIGCKNDRSTPLFLNNFLGK